MDKIVNVFGVDSSKFIFTLCKEFNSTLDLLKTYIYQFAISPVCVGRRNYSE